MYLKLYSNCVIRIPMGGREWNIWNKNKGLRYFLATCRCPQILSGCDTDIAEQNVILTFFCQPNPSTSKNVKRWTHKIIKNTNLSVIRDTLKCSAFWFLKDIIFFYATGVNMKVLKSDPHVPENFCQIKIFPSHVRKNAIIYLFGVWKWK